MQSDCIADRLQIGRPLSGPKPRGPKPKDPPSPRAFRPASRKGPCDHQGGPPGWPRAPLDHCWTTVGPPRWTTRVGPLLDHCWTTKWHWHVQAHALAHARAHANTNMHTHAHTHTLALVPATPPVRSHFVSSVSSTYRTYIPQKLSSVSSVSSR